MADELSRLSFEQDLANALGVEDAARWKVSRAGELELLVEITSAKAPAEIFQALLRWLEYPGFASMKFRDPATGRLDMPTAWPVVRGFRPATLDACVNWTLEGFNLHPEWRNDPNFKWNPSGNAVLRTLKTLQNEMDDHYTGRFKQ
jgi:hypothetical protein